MVNVKPTQKWLMSAFDDPRALRIMGEEAIKIIQRRTQDKKVDYNGHEFEGYTTAYKKKKKASRRSVTPDLTWSGRMLNAMQVVAINKDKLQAILGWVDREEGQKAAGNSKKRKFFDIKLAPEIERIAEVYRAALKWH